MTRTSSLAWLAAIAIFALGCGKPPPISKANVKLVEQLRTAVAAKRTDWLNLAAKQVDEHRQSGALSGAESEAVQAIINEARQGHWDEANRRMLWLIHGQQ
jgi:PBP1b-binding outer membrane lipoprotein LpoB